jgi:N-acetylglucosamine-6-phosphate deacetylase
MKLKGIHVETGSAIELTISNGVVEAQRTIAHEQNLPFISTGFYDLQVNGYRGIDYSSETLTASDMERLVYALAESGTTRHVPTIITNSRERISKNLSIIAKAVKASPLLQRAIPAIHVEGPFISSIDGPRGAHDAKYVRDPSIEEMNEWIESAQGLLKVVTLAPERAGAIDFIKVAVQQGITIAIGHSAASPDDIAAAVAAGATLSTHLGNGSHAELPRLKNYLWEQLANDNLHAGIIADGYHLPPSFMKVLRRTKGLDHIILVSDVAPIGGSEPGTYRWGDISTEVHPDGHISLAGTPFLAGAGHLLDRCIAQFANATGESLDRIIPLATTNGENLLNMQDRASLEPGSPVNITVFKWQIGEEQIEIERTLLGSVELYRKAT